MGSHHRGFAFVQFADMGSAEKAIQELNGTKICGRGVAVDFVVDAGLYRSLQREDERAQKEQLDAPEPKAAKKKGKVEEAPPKKKKGKKAATADEEDDDLDPEAKSNKEEMRRMKKLMNEDEDDEEDDKDEEEGDGKKKKKGKDKKKRKDKDSKEKQAPREAGFDINEKKTVFVRNVPFDATENDLRDTLRNFGTIRSVKFVADPTGQNAHRGTAFVHFFEASGATSALAAEAEADKRLKELSTVVKKSDQRELPAVEGFGISLKGRRLVLTAALTPGEMEQSLGNDKEEKRGKKKQDKRMWMHLLNVGRIE